MWVCFGGRERSTEASEDLLAAVSFVTRNIKPLRVDGDALVAIESKEDK